MTKNRPTLTVEQVRRLWLLRQGLVDVEKPRKLDRRAFVRHLEDTGGLQLDTVNVLDRAHYLTLWSRFGQYDRSRIDRWVYRDQVAYEYWGHEASILPISHLPCGLRRMRRFPPESWRNAAYWKRFDTSPASKRRVIARLKKEGALESTDFEKTPQDLRKQAALGWGAPPHKEDKRSLQLLWHAGKVAVADRRHFRKVYDLAERVYPAAEPASLAEYYDSWLQVGLSGNGVAPESHLTNYVTGPNLKAPERAKVIARGLKRNRIVQVRVAGFDEPYYALPEHLDGIDAIPEPCGLTLVCPFDSLLWQRKRAEQLLDFRYRVEIYVPEHKREFGYYVLPILCDGRLIGRLDPKFHRDRNVLEVKSLHWEPSIKRTRRLERDLTHRVEQLADFLGAENLEMP